MPLKRFSEEPNAELPYAGTELLIGLQAGDNRNFPLTELAKFVEETNTKFTTQGDLVVAGEEGKPERLPIGPDGYFLAVIDGVLTYVQRPGAASGEGVSNPMTAQGDMIVGGVDGQAVRLPAPEPGQYLTIKNGALTWLDFPVNPGELTNPMTGLGDMMRGGVEGAPIRIPAGTEGQLLRMVDKGSLTGILPEWSYVATGAPEVYERVGAEAYSSTIVPKFNGKYLRYETNLSVGNAVRWMLTVQPDASELWADSAEVTIEQSGDSTVEIVAGLGVTVKWAKECKPVTRGQYSVITLKRVAANTWTLFGNLEVL